MVDLIVGITLVVMVAWAVWIIHRLTEDDDDDNNEDHWGI